MRTNERSLLRAWLRCAVVVGLAAGAVAAERPRVIVLTDIENEPDDAMLTCPQEWSQSLSPG
jgi:hypothetical protein